MASGVVRAETHGQGAQVGLLGLGAAAAGPSGQGPLLQPAQQHGQHQVAHGLLGTQGPPQSEGVAAGKGCCEGSTETPARPAWVTAAAIVLRAAGACSGLPATSQAGPELSPGRMGG